MNVQKKDLDIFPLSVFNFEEAKSDEDPLFHEDDKSNFHIFSSTYSQPHLSKVKDKSQKGSVTRAAGWPLEYPGEEKISLVLGSAPQPLRKQTT